MKHRGVIALIWIAIPLAGAVVGYFSHDWINITYRLHRWEKKKDRFLDKPAPPINSTTIDGEPWTLSDQKGKVVLVDVWATWCGPCVAEHASLKLVYEQFKDRDDFEMVSISIDKEKQALTDFLAEHPLDWTQLHETGGRNGVVVKDYEVHGIPAIHLIDQNGILRHMSMRGREPIAKAIDGLLSESPQP